MGEHIRYYLIHGKTGGNTDTGNYFYFVSECIDFIYEKLIDSDHPYTEEEIRDFCKTVEKGIEENKQKFSINNHDHFFVVQEKYYTVSALEPYITQVTVSSRANDSSTKLLIDNLKTALSYLDKETVTEEQMLAAQQYIKYSILILERE